jgi:hypothetical protein
VGDVGVGKTAFVNYILTTKLRKHIEAKEVWYLRLDLERLGGDGCRLLGPIELMCEAGKKACQILKDHRWLMGDQKESEQFQSQLAEAVKALDTPTMDAGKADAAGRVSGAFGNLVSAIQRETGRRLVLILDNLDYICHRNDRGLFYYDDNTHEIPILIQLCQFVSMFLHEGALGNLGVNVLVVTRTDSYGVLQQVPGTSLFPEYASQQGKDCYHVNPIEWQDVLDCRRKLLSFAAKDVPEPGKQKQFAGITQLISRELLLGRPSLITHLQRITNYGFREMMHFFAQYGWVSDCYETSEELTLERFVHQYPVALLTFMLRGRLRFQQFNSRFPNIYLVNRQPMREGSTEHEHAHTYWLKRLICHYVDTCSNLTTHDFIDMFCDSNGGGYEKSVVRECLGSLSDSNCSNMLQITRERHPYAGRDVLQVTNVKLTSRGRHCLHFIFDRFFYLQLIVEDYHLPIPKVVYTQYDFDEHTPHYGYVTAAQTEYVERSRQMIRLKAKQVLLFLEILNISYQWEELFYQPVFDRLRKEHIELPSVEGIRKSVLEELCTLSASLGDFIDVEACERCAKVQRAAIEEDLYAAYAANQHDERARDEHKRV